MPAGAQAQPGAAVQRMVCSEAMGLVKKSGAILLNAGGSALERFVKDRSFCETSEIAELRFVPTRDNPECPVGYRCRELGFNDWDWQ
ncbi:MULTISPECIES: hypothetical protein [unclassified Methylobacterium]|uniref:hypothetical protein n=1 Tax=unclassified Methylobacterium TaxID=2615210 RepID=UPI001FCD0F40|nr:MULTISPECIES: hypothetical protein [unclassified Methylobacterium]